LFFEKFAKCNYLIWLQKFRFHPPQFEHPLILTDDLMLKVGDDNAIGSCIENGLEQRKQLSSFLFSLSSLNHLSNLKTNTHEDFEESCVRFAHFKVKEFDHPENIAVGQNGEGKTTANTTSRCGCSGSA